MSPIQKFSVMFLLLALLAPVCGHADNSQPRVLPEATPLPDGSWPWISGTPLLWQYCMDIIGDRQVEALSRSRMAELGRIDENGRLRGVHVGETQIFWSMNVAKREPVQVPAVLRKIGKHCYIYVQIGQEMSDETVNKLCHQFDEVIYPTDTGYFGQEAKPGIDWDERIVLLFMDILDGWEPGKGYVGGFFFPLNCYSTRIFPQSNEREMVILDTYPSDPTREDYLGVLAHEFQHLIHYNHDKRENVWLNESCSQLAFFVNGYGHAPQAFQFVKNSDTGMEEFDNGIDDYGAVYSFFYYLHEKYAGDTREEKMSFFRDLVDNKKKGLESLRETLVKHNIDKALEDIFLDWFIANTANVAQPGGGLWGYDDTYRIKLEPSARYSLEALPGQAVEKQEVQPWAADYITVVPDICWTPYCPTMLDIVDIRSKEAGHVYWTINDGAIPPQSLWPEGSLIEDGCVKSPLVRVNRDDGWHTFIGRFLRLGVNVERLNVRLAYAGGGTRKITIPVFSIESLTERKAGAFAAKGLKFEFDGRDKKNFALLSVMRTGSGVQVKRHELTEDNKTIVEFFQLPADLQELTFVVAALDGKKFKYEYRFESLGDDDLLAKAAQLRRVQSLADDQGVPVEKLARTADGLEGELARRLVASEQAVADLTARFAVADPERKKILRPIIRRVLRRAKYRALDEATSGAGDLLSSAAAMAASTRADDQDDSHDNLGYFTFKKMELIHALTHLKIDPQLIEGQILNTWTLLEISQGFPHLPIPDGLGIVDFKEERALSILKQWAVDFDLDYPFPDGMEPPDNRPVVYTDDLEKVKRVVQRLVIAESIIEYCYNSSLLMADDMSLCIYDFVRLILSSKAAVDDIAANFEGLPLVGPLVKRVKLIIHGKLVRVIQAFSNIIAAKLPAPYSSIVPTAVQLLGWVYGKIMHLDLPHENSSWLMETGSKLMGKYALTAIPEVGYVAKGQLAVDTAAERAAVLCDEGTIEEAVARVLDDGNDTTATSIREQIDTQIADRHATFVQNRKIADVARKLTTIFQYSSLIDPTAISKVLAIAAAVSSTGVLAHAGWRTGDFFFRLPRTFAIKGVEGAYGPFPEGMDPENRREAGLLDAPLDGNTVNSLLRSVDAGLARYRLLLDKALAAAGDKSNPGLFDDAVSDLMMEDSRFDEISLKLEAVVLADTEGLLKDSDALELYGRSQASSLERATVLADLAAACQSGQTSTQAQAQLAETSDYVKYLTGRVKAVLKKGAVHPVLLVSQTEVRASGDRITLDATISNLSAVAISDVAASLQTGARLEIVGGPDKQVGSLAAGSETRVSWEFKISDDSVNEMTMATIVLKADRVKPLSGFVKIR